MRTVNRLLQQALTSLQRTFGKRAAGLLLQGRDAVLPAHSQQVTAETEFELITWVVIQSMPARKRSLFGSVRAGDITSAMIEEAKQDLFRSVGGAQCLGSLEQEASDHA